MTKAVYIGVSGKARKVKKGYFGVSGKEKSRKAISGWAAWRVLFGAAAN